MSRGTAGIVLIMLAVLGLWLYVKSDIIQKLLGGAGLANPGPGSGGGGGSSGADMLAGAVPLDTGCSNCGGNDGPEGYSPNSGGSAVYPGGPGEPVSGSGNVGYVGTAEGVGFPSPWRYADYSPIPDPQRPQSGNLTDPVAAFRYGSIQLYPN